MKPKLSDTERQTLCTAVDLPAMLAADGVEVRKDGNHYKCALRPEKTPSCHVYPPGVGLRGADGWTLHDYGSGQSLDALGYLVDVRGLPFMDAVAELSQRAGFVPECLQGTPQTNAPRRTLPPAVPPIPETPTMALADQSEAACILWRAIVRNFPDAKLDAKTYLRGRGCGRRYTGNLGLVLTGEQCKALVPVLADDPAAKDLLLRAGILKPAEDNGKPLRLAWWDRVLLLACANTIGTRPTYFIARRLDWKDGDKVGKYLNQPTGAGAVRQPFNLPALYDHQPKEVLLVEGPLDAMAADSLGWPAVAMLSRPQARHYTDRNGAAVRMLEPHLDALRASKRVRVMPDNDPGEKGAEGQALAANLVGWLRAKGCKAELTTLHDLCPDAPLDCKDLADVAKLRFSTL